MGRRSHALALAGLPCLALCLLLWLGAATSLAASPWWQPTSGSRPTNLEPEGKGELVVGAENLGDAPASGEAGAGGVPIEIVDTLPAGLKATAAAGTVPYANVRPSFPCVVEESGSRVACTLEKLTEHSNVLPGIVPPYGQIEVRIAVTVGEAKTGEVNAFSISGGGALERSLSHPIVVSESPTAFGVEDYELESEAEGGAADLQAGSHPFQQTTTIELNQTEDTTPVSGNPDAQPAALPKDLAFKWPAGLIGNPTVIPQCTAEQFLTKINGGSENECPADTAVGVATVTVDEPHVFGTTVFTVPLFNLEPLAGEPARLGFNVVEANSPVYIDTALRTGGDYGVDVSSSNITETAGFLSAHVTVWGTPGAAGHDSARGWGCLLRERGIEDPGPCNAAEAPDPAPFLSLPSACTGPLQSTVEGDSWAHAGTLVALASDTLPALGGCASLAFGPTIAATPTEQRASAPTGLAVDVHVPEAVNEDAQGLAPSNIRDIAVAFPRGVALNPESADRLGSCSEGQVGFLGGRGAQEELLFSSDLPEAFCPDAATLGTVKIKTPLLPSDQPLEGALYLASSAANGEGGQNPFDSLLATYIVARDPVSGVLIKLPGSISLDPASGRLTSTFENTPDLAFEDAEINLFSGPRAPLETPTHCGVYTTEASFTPWSGSAPVGSSSSFEISSGPEGGPCPPETLPFTPALTAGSSTERAGAFGDVSLLLARANGQQRLVQAAGTGPAGLSAMIANVTPCPEPQAAQGACPASSQIGHAIVTAGTGSLPLSLPQPGAPEFPIYLTGPYEGAPFGASIVTPIVAGPLNLGTIVTRAKIGVDPRTAQVTVATDPLPQIIKGVPTDLRSVSAIFDRPNFTFNPTSCGASAFAGTAWGAPPPGEAWSGTAAPISSRFQVGSCGELGFTPKVAIATGGWASKKNGASLSVKIAYPQGAFGQQAWFSEAKFDIPKQLPARLTTLQQACPAKTFESNRKACPAHSLIGHAIVHTEVLPVPLAGPVYFVSYGNARFPDVVMALEGDNVQIELDGETFIDAKTGVTSATFKDTPDVPFESIEVNLPTGGYSEFGANLPGEDNYDFCGQRLSMPYLLKAQNGLEIKQSAPLSVSGCPKQLALSAHELEGRTLRLTVYAPAAGKLKVSGKGLTTRTKTAAGQELLTLTLKQKRAGKLSTKVRLVFTPKQGKKQSKTLTIQFK